jgi:hypothetical protein
MEKIEHTDANGRKYSALSNGEGMVIIIGPQDGIVDSLNLPEPFATNLHNILYTRGILDFKTASRGQNLIGALQEAFLLDAQKLLEAFSKFEQGGRHD